MIRINILSGVQKDPFFAQWDKERFPETEYYICENSVEDIIWDIVVVYENVKHSLTIKCKQGGLIYVAGEPPMMRPLPNVFLKQFDKVVIPNINSKHSHKILSHGFLNWSLGVNFRTKKHRYDFRQLKYLETIKTKNISIVTSNKRMMPGHNRRMKIINKLREDFPTQIDFYGTGHNFVEYKADALIPYRFHICMENSTIPYYWTEKFSDPILANCIPIYCGCTNINDYFDKRGYETFSCNDYSALKSLINKILKDPEEMYQKYYPYMRQNREAILAKENLIPFIIGNYSPNLAKACAYTYTLKGLSDFKIYKYEFYFIRIKRLLYKLYFKLSNSCV